MAARKKPKSYQDNCEKIALRRKAKIYARRFYRIGFIAAILFIGSFGIWLWSYDEPKGYFAFIGDRFYNLTAKTGFMLEKVDFEGNKYVGSEDLATKLDLEYGRPILGLDLEDLRTQIKQQPWIKNARVQRILPANLKISIEERAPIAIWQLNKQYSLIDEEGVVLTSVDSPEVLPFPLIVGEGANKHASEIFQKLKSEKKLYDLIDSAVMMGERRWNVMLSNGIEVMLPADNMEQAWGKLARMDEQDHLLNRQIKSIDLRLPDRIYIKTIDGDLIKRSGSA